MNARDDDKETHTVQLLTFVNNAIMTYTINIFVSHSWSYTDHYEKLCEWIFDKNWNTEGNPILFVNTSVPKENPIHYASNTKELTGAIYRRVEQSDVVVIPTGMYANYSDWIKREIDGAREMAKPILAVNPWAQERKSAVVEAASDLLVGWNSESVVKGIWNLYHRSDR